MADVDESKVGKSGVGNAAGDSSQLSAGQKRFVGKIMPSPTPKIERLLKRGSALAATRELRRKVQQEEDAQWTDTGVDRKEVEDMIREGGDQATLKAFRHLPTRGD